ncbi:MotA/TolQ/ExbB proton channel family protein [Shewanella khirikhana]|nr:MotA/TolQ/ExbB proton channel family protein [Shewanella khirikhana]
MNKVSFKFMPANSRRLKPGLMSALALVALSAFSTPQAQAVDIKASKAKLEQLEREQLKERQALQSSLNALERELISLRREASDVRRAADESSLSLDALKKRTREWRSQADYQRAAIGRFMESSSSRAPSTDSISPANISSDKLSSDKLSPDNINLDKLSPANLKVLSKELAAILPESAAWQTKALAMDDGRIKTLPVLTVGPVSWYLDGDAAGFVSQTDSGLRVGISLAADGLAALKQGEPGSIEFDPTLERAMARAKERESVPEHVEKGGLWAVPILAFGAFALVISLFKGVQLMRLPQVQPLLAERMGSDGRLLAVDGIEGMQAELMDVTLASAHGRSRDDKLFALLLAQKQKLEYFVGAVAITAAVSPLLGLLGTVSGMIETFKLMTLFGAGDPQAVSGGISEALVTTELGLIVAIPALLAHALLSRRVKTYYGQLESCAIHLSQLDPKPREGAAS